MNNDSFKSGQELYLAVRTGFVGQGSSLTAWCRENGINPTSARSVLIGTWNGPKGMALRSRIIDGAGISHSPIAVNQ